MPIGDRPKPKNAQLFAARAKASGEFPKISRNRTATVRMKDGGSYSYSYADLSDVLEAVNPVLAAHGLSVWQFPRDNQLHTVITHESGETFEAAPWPIKPMPKRSLDDCQSYQSAVQVAKRYALSAFLGITTEETVEGNTRTGRDRRVNMDDNFETGDGVRLPRGAKIDRSWTKEKKAKEVARAIEAQFDDVKTVVGLEGVWDRNSDFIERLREGHSSLYSDLFDKFQFLCDEKGVPKEGEAA